MYWLRSVFTISSRADIKILIRMYVGVSGELQLRKDEKDVLEIKWSKKPFKRLFNNPRLPNDLETSYQVRVRLIGPSTIISISPKLKKIDKKTFEHPNKGSLLIISLLKRVKIFISSRRTNDSTSLIRHLYYNLFF